MNFGRILQEILAAGDANRAAAGGKDLKNWRSPSEFGQVARVLSAAKDFVKQWNYNNEVEDVSRKIDFGGFKDNNLWSA